MLCNDSGQLRNPVKCAGISNMASVVQSLLGGYQMHAPVAAEALIIVGKKAKVNAVELIKSKSCVNRPDVVMILAHGAGAPADSLFMEELSARLEEYGVPNVRFEFPYMQKRREDGKKRPPDRQPKLLECFSEVVDQVRDEVGSGCLVFVGGKSMGGRMASVLASERRGIDGVVGFGYPFHAPGKTDKWRTGHFGKLSCPMLVVQGTRDPFGKREEMAGHEAELEGVRLHWLEGGNHDFQPLARQKSSQQALIAEAAGEACAFIAQCQSAQTLSVGE